MCRFRSQLVVMLLLAGCCPNVFTARLQSTETQTGKKTLEDEDFVPAPVDTHNIIQECISTTSADGTFYIKSEGGRADACGLYLFSNADTVIEIQLGYMNVPCHTGSLIALVDGWEMNGQLWPSPADHGSSTQERVQEYCGTAQRRVRFRSEQNTALLQYRLPAAGSALSIHVRHVPSPKPCNQLMDGTTEVFTLRNFGQRRNCTLLSMNPAEVQMLPFHVGAASAATIREVRTAQPHTKCVERGWADFVEIGEATSLDTAETAAVSSRLCGLSSTPGPTQSVCSMLVTRLVSSGQFDNVVRVRARLLPAHRMLALCFANYQLEDEFEEALKDYSW